MENYIQEILNSVFFGVENAKTTFLPSFAVIDLPRAILLLV